MEKSDWEWAYTAARIGVGLYLVVQCSVLFNRTGMFEHKLPLSVFGEVSGSGISMFLIKIYCAAGLGAGIMLLFGAATRFVAGVAAVLCLAAGNVLMGALCLALVSFWRLNRFYVDLSDVP